MGDLIEVLIIAAIFLLPAMEAWTRKRKQERRGGEAGGETDGSGASPPSRSRTTPAERGEETSSEVLLPEDLWEELTGQRRRSGAGEASRGETSRGGEPGADARPGAPSKAEEWKLGGEEASPAGIPSTRDRESDGPLEGYQGYEPKIPPAEELPGEPIGANEIEEAAVAEEIEEAAVAEEMRRRGRLPTGEAAARGAFRRSRASELTRLLPDRMARRGAAPAHARKPHPLVGELDRQALRRAVVYREILGPPVSLRDE